MESDSLAAMVSLAPESWRASITAAFGGFLILSGVCALIDANVPQPAPGSRWVTVRRVITVLGHNYRFAANRIPLSSLPPPEAAAARAVESAVPWDSKTPPSP